MGFDEFDKKFDRAKKAGKLKPFDIEPEDEIEPLLKDALAGNEDLTELYKKRFVSYMSKYSKSSAALRHISDAFKNIEYKLLETIKREANNKIEPEDFKIIERLSEYVEIVKTLSPKPPNHIKSEIVLNSINFDYRVEFVRLFYKLTFQKRGIHAPLFNPSTLIQDLAELFSEGYISNKIQWMYDKQLLIYFMRLVLEKFTVYPDRFQNLEDKGWDKEMNRWTNRMIEKYFVDKNGLPFEASKLNSLRYTIKDDLDHKTRIDDMVSQLFDLENKY